MSRTLTIDTDDLLDDALRARAHTQGKTVPEIAREILSRVLLGRRLGRSNAREEPSKPSDNRLPPLNRRDREHAWRRSNRAVLQERFAGHWVVLEGEEIVAHGKDAVRAVEEAKTKGVVVPYVFYVQPPRPPGVVRLGL